MFKRALKSMDNQTATLNGAVTFKSTLNDVLDFYYHAPVSTPEKSLELFKSAFEQDKKLALKAAFYMRDIRNGKGRRENFRVILRWLAQNETELFNKAVDFVPEYGRWDDILEYVENVEVYNLVKGQLYTDQTNENPSLLAKWMPSENATSKKSKEMAKRWSSLLGMTPREYRKMLSEIRAKIKIVESQMSQNDWADIEYTRVPSVANMRYKKAFSRHDADRYTAFIKAAQKGEVKINSSVLYPYQMVTEYVNFEQRHNFRKMEVDETIEALWKQLPDYVNGKRAIAVCDVSGSMLSGQNPKVRPMDVAVSISIYLAERNKGKMKDCFITFTDKPAFIELTGKNLAEKVTQVFNAGVGYNTNIEAVFETIIKQARRFNVHENEMPEILFILSDMEFDSVGGMTAFENAKQRYKDAGYKMPAVVFWNIDSKQTQTPVEFDERGVMLVSGYSTEIMKAALNLEVTNPLDMMLKVLDKYKFVDEL